MKKKTEVRYIKRPSKSELLGKCSHCFSVREMTVMLYYMYFRQPDLRLGFRRKESTVSCGTS